MTGGLFDRWRAAPVAVPETLPAVGLQVWLDDQARVLRLAGPLRTLLALPARSEARVHDYVEQHSWLVLEGEPADWQGQPLDLDFRTVMGHALHTRGWLQRQASGWMLQLFDIGDLLREQRWDRQRPLLGEIGHALRECGSERLAQTTAEQLQSLAEHWQASSLRLMLRESGGWRHYAGSEGAWPWPDDPRLQGWLDALPAHTLIEVCDDPELLALCGGVSLFLVPYRLGLDAEAWILCAGARQVPPADMALALARTLAEPLLVRHRRQQMQRQAHHLDDLQRQLGAGWWEWPAHADLHLEPALARTFGLPCQASPAQWLARLHPADREAAQLALAQAREGAGLSLSIRLADSDPQGAPRWFHWAGHGQGGLLRGFLLDISALKVQEQQAGAARARLENLIASSPAVIYVQRYAEGALHSDFFSASLGPLLGWAADSEQARQPGLAVHPQDRPLWLERTRSLLREGQVRCRYRLRDHLGGYHWMHDEARLLRDDLGQPLEVVGLWLDVSEATEAAERMRQSEERYRVLVEDSPAMICRYRPDLTLLFGNRPLADYLGCAPEQLQGADLGQWFSDSQREAFVQRLQALTPEQPLGSAEICVQLPGREHAWWVWADRGLFDAEGRLLEVQAVGRDNTDVRRSQQQLLQGAKMATLGELATGLVHEINQPLNVMQMAVGNTLKRLQSGTADPAYLEEKLRRIEGQVVRAARLVEHMRVYGRRSAVERERFAAWAAVEGARALLEEGLRGKGVELCLERPEAQPQVLGHQDQVEQVLINLMVNARDALLEKGRQQPWIRVRQVVQGERLCLLVEDNAGGIDPRLHERIFEPFFTTKPAGVGTGLGLSVSHGIVSRMGGSLTVANAIEGACFQVVLPLHSTN
ncbi:MULTISPECIES: PAS domain-containing sensor histidine kinase [unclassified Pseudomonas]|uniref:PAS domain-containing sensor histidine kinase n=1 Tax=unclassified Pseudomonas TaxID=196821 RepID=UPI00244D6205|nr:MULTISPECIES: PAS domain-containing sensor histidine kinase [unclassified Pseudomonas]MDH0305269.1 ATP-binding protein [Pseudomonas sp. GD04091]MDH1986866.1 ATP-binding protein [Pseudomonas sp. GD03689]